MKIRSITYFMNPHWPMQAAELEKAQRFASTARRAYEQAGYEVQTMRLATVSFPELLPELTLPAALELARQVEEFGHEHGFDFLSLGTATPERLEAYELIPEVLRQTESIFMTGLMTGPGGEVSLPAVQACARIVQALAPVLPEGFKNLYFAALANVPAGTPFLPAAYHAGEQAGFALAVEGADLAVMAAHAVGTLAEMRQAFIGAIESHAHSLVEVGEGLQEQLGAAFMGIDFTPAPFPVGKMSLGTAMEQMGLKAVGDHGSLAAAAFLADAVDRARFPRAGFSGLIFPVLEDAALAHSAAAGRLSVKDLLLYSTVCGTGLDTVPLPGDLPADQIAAVLLDVAALAQRLDKPLTARLMPIPGKQAGDETSFNFPFFVNSRVLPVQAEALGGLLGGGEVFDLRPRRG